MQNSKENAQRSSTKKQMRMAKSMQKYMFSCEVLSICSFICQGTSTKKQRRDLFGFRDKLPPVITSLTTQR